VPGEGARGILRQPGLAAPVTSLPSGEFFRKENAMKRISSTGGNVNVLSIVFTTGLALAVCGALAVLMVTAAPTAALAAGGTLRVALQTDIIAKQPHRLMEANFPWLLAVYDTLTRYDNTFVPQPALVEKYSWSADGKTLTLSLRKGVKFHSGRELTSEDVELNFKHLDSAKAASQLKPILGKITGFERPDAQTLVIKFKAPAPDFFDTAERMMIIDPKAIDAIEEGTGPQVGTGPFIWKEWVPGSKLVVERNPNYWQAGQPMMDRIEYTIVPNREAMTLTLEAGSVDLIVTPDAKDVLRLKSNAKYAVIPSTNQTPTMYLGAYVTAKPLDDKRVRQALNFAMPRQRFADTILLKLSEPNCLPWPKISPAYDEKLAKAYPYDLAKARSLLKDAGVQAGLAMNIGYSTGQKELKEFAVLYEQELNDLGLKVTIEGFEPAVFSTRVVNKQFKNLWLGVAEGAALYPASLLTQNNPWRAGNNTSDFRSDAFEDTVAKMSTELDPAKQKGLFARANQILIDESFNMPITNQPYFWVSAAKLTGFAFSKSNMIVFTKITMSK
jgi:peptide/nickel transport system substrate-binding protein